MDEQADTPPAVMATTTDRALVLRVDGALDDGTRSAADAVLRAAVAALPPPPLVVVDLSAVELLSAAGARTLRQLVALCLDKGVQVRFVVRPACVVRRVLAITGLDGTAPVLDSVDAALAAPLGGT